MGLSIKMYIYLYSVDVIFFLICYQGKFEENSSPFFTTKKYGVQILPTSNDLKNSLKSGPRMFGGDQGEALASLVVPAPN